MKIIIERNIPYIKGIFEPFAEVLYLHSDEIDSNVLKSADALITRTRPLINKGLLEGSDVRVIATATIGTDHIDLDYCKSRGIEVFNAPGCNAPAVAQWVFAAVRELMPDISFADSTLGIVGVGNVGKIVERWGRKLGFRTLLCDPPREEREGKQGFVDMATIARESDVITFHTPLTHTGNYPTAHLINPSFLEQVKDNAIILNAARGNVAQTDALIDYIEKGKIRVAIDCWEGEPDIDKKLLKIASITTPHIAGYSVEGKKRATLTAINAVARVLSLPVILPFEMPPVNMDNIDMNKIRSGYDILLDSNRLKANPMKFEALRDNYELRNEP